MSGGCPFCGEEKIASPIEWFGSVRVFEPLGPVVPGHLLVVPSEHVETAATDPEVSARTMAVAARIAGRLASANIITSLGSPATQTVNHLHLHVVPREDGDGLLLPWVACPQTHVAVTRFAASRIT